MHIFLIILSAIQFNSVIFNIWQKRAELRTKELYNNMHHMQKTAMKFK